MRKVNIALVGATGLVGRTVLQVLEEYDIEVNNLKLFASFKSKGKKLIFKNKEYVCKNLYEGCFKNMDYVIFCAGKEVSKTYALEAEKEGAIVIDNSSYFRMNDDVSLIVPEINMDSFYYSTSNIIANPNCSTIQSVLPLFAISKKYKLKRVIYTTYQSISGAGQKAINSFSNLLNNINDNYFPYDLTKTCIPFIDSVVKNSYSNEEMKMINETKKILNDYDLEVTATCVRVPIINCHAVSILVELDSSFEIEDIIKLFKEQKGIIVFDNIENNMYPNSLIAKDNDYVYVGRIRKDLSSRNGLLFYVVSDNLRKGAASNVVQILKNLIDNE